MLEAFRQQNNFFIVYVYHKFTLLDRLNSGMMPYNLVRGYTLQLTRALEFLHSRFVSIPFFSKLYGDNLNNTSFIIHRQLDFCKTFPEVFSIIKMYINVNL